MNKKLRMQLKALIYALLFLSSLTMSLDFLQKAILILAIIDLWLECSEYSDKQKGQL